MEKKQMKKKAVTFNLDHSFNQCLHQGYFSDAVVDMIKYFMFARHQIPVPFPLLKAEYSALQQKKDGGKNEITKRLDKYSNNLFNFMENISVSLNDLSTLYMKNQIPEKIVLIFGSTIISPKEIIIIESNLGCTCIDQEKNVTDATKLCKTLSRKLLKFIVTNEEIIQLKSLSLVNIFILLCYKRSLSTDLLTNLSFSPRINYQLPSRGLKHQISLCSCCNEQIRNHKELDIAEKMSSMTIAEDCYWYISRNPLKGFRDRMKKGDWMG